MTVTRAHVTSRGIRGLSHHESHGDTLPHTGPEQRAWRIKAPIRLSSLYIDNLRHSVRMTEMAPNHPNVTVESNSTLVDRCLPLSLHEARWWKLYLLLTALQERNYRYMPCPPPSSGTNQNTKLKDNTEKRNARLSHWKSRTVCNGVPHVSQGSCECSLTHL